MIRRLLVAVPLLAACEAQAPVAVTVQARNATAVWVDAGGGWVEVPVDGEVARFDVDTPYALAVSCDVAYPRARFVLAGPDDADRWFLDCPGITEPWVATTFALPEGVFADIAIDQQLTTWGGITSVGHRPGARDVVISEYGVDRPRAMILHDLDLPGGTTYDVDFDRDGVALEQRERIIDGQRSFDIHRRGAGVMTARGTSMQLPGEVPTAALAEGDAAWAYELQGTTEGPYGFALVDTAASDGALTFDLFPHSASASVSDTDGVVARWSTETDWNRVSVISEDGGWELDAYPGWVTAHEDGELVAPEAPDPWDGWDAILGAAPLLLLATDDGAVGIHGEIWASTLPYWWTLTPGPSGRP